MHIANVIYITIARNIIFILGLQNYTYNVYIGKHLINIPDASLFENYVRGPLTQINHFVYPNR